MFCSIWEDCFAKRFGTISFFIFSFSAFWASNDKGSNHKLCDFQGRPRFGSVRPVTVRGWNGSSGSGFRFWRFLCKKVFSVFQYSLTGKDGSGSGFGSWKMVDLSCAARPQGERLQWPPGKRFRRFRFRFRFREKRFRRFRFPGLAVPKTLQILRKILT